MGKGQPLKGWAVPPDVVPPGQLGPMPQDRGRVGGTGSWESEPHREDGTL